MIKPLIKIAKYLWLVLVFGGVFLYLVTNFDTVMARLQIVSLPRLVLSHVFLIMGKLLLVELSRQSVEVIAIKPKFKRMFYINSLSQLAKYLPGGVWHFIGRAGYYHSDGLTIKQATQAMIVENIWLVSSAGFVGAIFFILYLVDASAVLSVSVLTACWVALLFIMTRWRAPNATLKTTFAAFLLQTAIWLLLGLSLWILIPTDIPGLFQLSISAFALSWVIGYVTLFAPSGLGVREGMLTAIFAVAISPSTSVVYAAVNRAVWVISELILGIIARTVVATPPANLSVSAPEQTPTQ